MRFHKVGKHALRCIVSAQEMWESGMQVDDFLKDREKTEEFIREIVEKARTEVGFECAGDMFSVQVSLMADSSVVLMISNEEPGIMSFLNAIKERMTSMHQGQPPCEEQDFVPMAEPIEEPLPKPVMSNTQCVFALQDMDEAIHSADRLLGNFDLRSALYKLDDIYYLVLDIDQEGLKPKDILPFITEYTLGDSADEAVIAHIKEYGRAVIKESAVEVLSAL